MGKADGREYPVFLSVIRFVAAENRISIWRRSGSPRARPQSLGRKRHDYRTRAHHLSSVILPSLSLLPLSPATV